ncbi:hypothetical protein ABMA70_14590 [Halobacteriovorax sp. XZX-3]|uniref:hypothetical protein n=1 Tax=unclassified Halobacteriovorax TaxID=2639665 RepID=UPI00371447C1
MKRIIFANLLVLIAFTIKAGREFKDQDAIQFEKNLNAHISQAVEIANLKQEVARHKETIQEIKTEYQAALDNMQTLVAANQQAKQYIGSLKTGNDKLATALDKGGLVTPELAKFITRESGRLPASSQSKK